MVLFHQKDEEDILLFVQGIPYALQKLKGNAVQDKTEENYRMVQHILRHVNRFASNGKSALRCVAGYGLRWKDAEVWKQAVSMAGADKDVNVFGKEMILKACKRLEDTVKGCPTFREQVNVIEYLCAQSSKQKVLQWCSTQTSRILVHAKTLTACDVEAMMSVIAVKGLSVVVDALSTQVGGSGSLDFWVALITAVHGRRDHLIGHPQPTSVANENSQDQTDSFDGDLAKCFDAAVRQCPFNATSVISHRNYWGDMFYTNVSPMLRLMDLCLTTGNMTPCAQLLSRVTTSTDDLAKQFQVLHIPFLDSIRRLLDKHRFEFCSPPFGDFARTLIGRYLSGVLRAKPSEPKAKMRRIGCGCPDCQALDTFLMSDKPTTEFRMRQDRRAHLGRQALTAKDLLTFHTINTGSPHALVMTKTTEIFNQWLDRLKVAQTLLSSIGDAPMIEKIMGSRYGDVQKALDGTQVYVVKPSMTGPQQRINTNVSALHSTASRMLAPGPIRTSIPSTNLSSSLKRKREGDR